MIASPFAGISGRATALAALALLAGPAAAFQTSSGGPAYLRQQEFAAAASQSHVPLQVLLAVSYAESQWESPGQPSYSGGYGPMNLTDLTQAILTADRFSADRQRSTDLLNAPALHTAAPAAALAGLPLRQVETSDSANIRAGAALLASYERQYNFGLLPADPGGWYVAVARYAQAAEPRVAQVFADDVYAVIEAGASRTTQDGQIVKLTADPGVQPDRDTIGRLHLADLILPPASPVQDPAQIPGPECPADLHCVYSPSAYSQFGADKSEYGDHAVADRPSNLPIRYITLHDNEATADAALWLFHDPAYQASAAYEVTSSGDVIQMVPVEDIAWDTGNRSFYQHSIGIEQEGYAIDGAAWYTPAMYAATAKLVRYLAARFHIPLDRAHILGHDSVPAVRTPALPASTGIRARTGTGRTSWPWWARRSGRQRRPQAMW